jgi:hypothetical protein
VNLQTARCNDKNELTLVYAMKAYEGLELISRFGTTGKRGKNFKTRPI